MHTRIYVQVRACLCNLCVNTHMHPSALDLTAGKAAKKMYKAQNGEKYLGDDTAYTQVSSTRLSLLERILVALGRCGHSTCVLTDTSASASGLLGPEQHVVLCVSVLVLEPSA